MTFSNLGDLMVLTLRNPARAVRALLGLELPVSARWMVLILAVALSTLLAGVARLMFPPVSDDQISVLLGTPVSLAALQFGAMVISAGAIALIGRSFGGIGTFDDAILLVGWVEMILVGVQAVQLVAMLLFPATATLMSLMAFALSIYLTISMTKELHGFSSTPKVALGFIGGVFLVGLVLSILAAMLGILPEVTP